MSTLDFQCDHYVTRYENGNPRRHTIPGTLSNGLYTNGIFDHQISYRRLVHPCRSGGRTIARTHFPDTNPILKVSTTAGDFAFVTDHYGSNRIHDGRDEYRCWIDRTCPNHHLYPRHARIFSYHFVRVRGRWTFVVQALFSTTITI